MRGALIASADSASTNRRHEPQEVTTLDNAGPLLETKLYVPRLRRGLVARPRLIERMSRGAESKLTLISAPAGFGKTTLLAEWLAAAPADWTVRGVALARPGRQRARVLLDLPDRRAADGGAGGRRTGAVPAAGAPAAADRDGPRARCSTSSARCRTTSCWCSTTTT